MLEALGNADECEMSDGMYECSPHGMCKHKLSKGSQDVEMAVNTTRLSRFPSSTRDDGRV